MKSISSAIIALAGAVLMFAALLSVGIRNDSLVAVVGFCGCFVFGLGFVKWLHYQSRE